MNSVLTPAQIPYERHDILPDDPFDFDGSVSKTIEQYVVPIAEDSNLWIAHVAPGDENPWTVDPNIDNNQSWTVEEARRIAALILRAADIAEGLNG